MDRLLVLENGIPSSFTLMQTLIFIVIGLVLVFFVVMVTRLFLARRKENKAPRLTVDAKVLSRRTQVGRTGTLSRGDMEAGPVMAPGNNYTQYFITFEMESGDRMELAVNRNDFGLIVDGDRGKLTFQGTHLVQFDRY